jgi:hypothetical protein
MRPIRDQMGVAGGVNNLQWLFTASLVGVTTRAVPRFTLHWTYEERRPMKGPWQVVSAPRLVLLPS